MAHKQWQQKLLEDEAMPVSLYEEFTEASVNFVKGQPTHYLECRAGRHHMDLDVQYIIPSGKFSGCKSRVYVCGRCDTVRIDFLTAKRRRVFYRKYIYPDDYEFKGRDDKGGLKRDLVALALDERVTANWTSTLVPEIEELLKKLEGQ